ncbi:MAG: ferritin-like domain-containing protein, partial [Acidimicrobiia bacterium]
MGHEELSGQTELDDLESILALTNTDTTSTHHGVDSSMSTVFSWDYERSRAPLGRLYEKAKSAQWNGATDLPWDTEVDQEKV